MSDVTTSLKFSVFHIIWDSVNPFQFPLHFGWVSLLCISFAYSEVAAAVGI